MSRPNALGQLAVESQADVENVDLSEKGRAASGEAISVDRRLFMQFLAFGGCEDTGDLIRALEETGVRGVLYEDINDPYGVGLLTFSESPDYFVEEMRRFLKASPFGRLTAKPEHTMLGRTYTLGYEPDLEETLIGRPIRRVCDPALPWAVWYPLRRAGTFEQLSSQEQGVILKEHGGIGRAFGRAQLGYDIRLACHGLDKADNDFVIGLLGAKLYPLSMIVQRMRKTKQTSLHLEHLGPFFIGRAAWQVGDGAAS